MGYIDALFILDDPIIVNLVELVIIVLRVQKYLGYHVDDILSEEEDLVHDFCFLFQKLDGLVVEGQPVELALVKFTGMGNPARFGTQTRHGSGNG